MDTTRWFGALSSAVLLTLASASCTSEADEAITPDAADTAPDGASPAEGGASEASTATDGPIDAWHSADAAVESEAGNPCDDGLTVEEYCSLCQGNPAEGCDVVGYCGKTLAEVLNPYQQAQKLAGCGYVVLDFGNSMWGARRVIFLASSGELVGFFVSGDTNFVNIMCGGGYVTEAGDLPAEGCLCPCEVDTCLATANNTGCDAGVD